MPVWVGITQPTTEGQRRAEGGGRLPALHVDFPSVETRLKQFPEPKPHSPNPRSEDLSTSVAWAATWESPLWKKISSLPCCQAATALAFSGQHLAPGTWYWFWEVLKGFHCPRALQSFTPCECMYMCVLCMCVVCRYVWYLCICGV